MNAEEERIQREVLLWLHHANMAMTYVRELKDNPERRKLHRSIEDQIEREKSDGPSTPH